MLFQAKLFNDKRKTREALERNIANGRAFEVFKSFIRAEGGDVSYLDNPSKFPTAMYSYPIRSMKSGYISEIDTLNLGLISMHLGAGREKKGDVIDMAAGIVLNKKLGDKVNKGDLLLTLYTERSNMQAYETSALNCFSFSQDVVPVAPTVEELITYDQDKDEFSITKN